MICGHILCKCIFYNWTKILYHVCISYNYTLTCILCLPSLYISFWCISILHHTVFSLDRLRLRYAVCCIAICFSCWWCKSILTASSITLSILSTMFLLSFSFVTAVLLLLNDICCSLRLTKRGGNDTPFSPSWTGITRVLEFLLYAYCFFSRLDEGFVVDW